MFSELFKPHQLDPTHWVDKYGDYLFNYTIARVYGQEVAEDIVQETFLAALKAKENFKGESSEKTWLFSILKRKIVDHYRKKSRDKESLVESFEKPFNKEGVHEGGWMMHRAPAEWPLEKMESDDGELFMEVLRICLALLPPKIAASFSLKTIEELSTNEVCKELGITTSNLWVMLHRARLQLRECIDDKWYNN